MKFILLCSLPIGLFAQAEGPGGIPLLPVTATLQNAAVANGNGTALNVANWAGVLITVNCSIACSGGTLITFQGSDSLGNYVAIPAQQVGVLPATISSTVLNQGTTLTVWLINVTGFTNIRTPISAYSAGTITVTATSVASTFTYPYTTLSGTAVSAEQATATNGQVQKLASDLVGKLITMLYANPENFVSGTNSATGTGSTSIIAAEGSGVRTYVTWCHATNTSSTNSSVSIEDGSTVLDVLSVPANGGNNAVYPVPLRGTANTALNSVAGTGVTTLYVTCGGFKGQ